MATAASFASLLAYAVVLFIGPAANNELARFYRATLSDLGQLPLAMMAGFLPAVIWAGRFSDKHGKLPPMLGGAVCMSLGLVLFSITRDFRVAVGASLLMGVGGGLCEGTSMALLADLYSDSRRTSMMNISQAMFGVGAVAAPLAIGWLIRAGMDWRLGYVGAAIVCAVTAAIAAAAVAMRKERPVSSGGEGGGWREVVSNRLVVWLGIGVLLYVGAELGQSNWLSVYLKRDLAAAGDLAALSLSFMWFGIGIGRLLAAWVSRSMTEAQVIRWSLGFAAICQITLILMTSPWPALVAAFGLGIGLGPVFPTIVSIAGAAYPKQSGTVTAIVIALGPVGGGIFPKLIGVVADHTGMRAALWICVLCLAANIAVFSRRRDL